MSRAAGLDDDEGLTMGEAVYKWGPYTVQVWDYYSHEFMNALYMQADAAWKLSSGWSLAASAQAMRQQDVGEALYGEFYAFQAGVRGALTWRKTTLTLAFTDTADDHDMVNPWAAWPGYTSIMELNNDQAGQCTLLFRLGADLAQYGIKGLEATLTHTRSTVPDGRTLIRPDQLESDVDLRYYFQGELEAALAQAARRLRGPGHHHRGGHLQRFSPYSELRFLALGGDVTVYCVYQRPYNGAGGGMGLKD